MVTVRVMKPSPIQDVADTAYMIAAYRAVESRRPDALFRDPFAERLAGEQGQAILQRLARRVGVGWTVAIRTVLIDEFIAAAIAEGAETVLNLGAGLDARPYRLELPPELRWIEVDYAKTIEAKEAVLAGEKPRCRLERVKLDLADRSARAKLFASVVTGSRGILVLTEGVVPYLPVEEVASLADDLRRLPAVRWWVIDYFSKEALRYRKRKSELKFIQNAPFKFDPPDWFAFFEQHGWHAAEVKYLTEEGTRLKRPIDLPWFWKLAFIARMLFMSAARRERMKKFTAYVLLRPNDAK